MQNRPSPFARFLGRLPTTLDWVLVASLSSVLVLICACGSCFILPALARFGSGGTTTTTYQAPVQPTVTATVAATHTTAPVEAPTVGASHAAFAATFANQIDGKNWQVQVAGKPAVLHVIERVGTDSQQRVILAAIDPLPADYGKVTYPQATAVAYIMQFLPADAHETGTETEKDGSVAHFLHSASLVPLLPASAYPFGQPGDLYWTCNSLHGSSGLDNCEIGLA